MPALDTKQFAHSGIRLESQPTTTGKGDEQLMLFRLGAAVFVGFITDIYKAISFQWEAYHDEFPVTVDEFIKYSFTALRSRVARVNHESRHIRTNDPWYIPAVIAAAANAIGRVEFDKPFRSVTPVWNHDYDSYLLTEEEWYDVTGRLRVTGRSDKFKVTFVRKLSGDFDGDPAVMGLVPILSDAELAGLDSVDSPSQYSSVVDEKLPKHPGKESAQAGDATRDGDGTYFTRVTRDTDSIVRSYNSWAPVDGISAFVYALMGFQPDMTTALSLPEMEVLRPPFTIRHAAVMKISPAVAADLISSGE